MWRDQKPLTQCIVIVRRTEICSDHMVAAQTRPSFKSGVGYGRTTREEAGMAETQRVAVVTGAAGRHRQGDGAGPVGGRHAGRRRRSRSRSAGGGCGERTRTGQGGRSAYDPDRSDQRLRGGGDHQGHPRSVRPHRCLVNNAGIGPGAIRPDSWQRPLKFSEITPDQWRRFVAVHTTAPLALTNAVVPEMMREGWGRIVNITTSLGTMLNAGSPTYGPPKQHSRRSARSWRRTSTAPGSPLTSWSQAA